MSTMTEDGSLERIRPPARRQQDRHKITREDLMEVCRTLGLDPNKTYKLHIEPDSVEITEVTVVVET